MTSLRSAFLPFITDSSIRYGLSADKTTYVSEALANRLKKAQKNDLLLATTSENDEDVVKPLAWLWRASRDFRRHDAISTWPKYQVSSLLF